MLRRRFRRTRAQPRRRTATRPAQATVTKFRRVSIGIGGRGGRLLRADQWRAIHKRDSDQYIVNDAGDALCRINGSVTVSFNAVAENVQAGTPGSGFYFKQWACSIRNPGFGNLLYVPSFILPATTDSPTNNQAQYVLGYYRPDGSSLGTYTCGQVSQLAIPTTTPTTLAAICTYNAPGAIVPPNTGRIQQTAD